MRKLIFSTENNRKNDEHDEEKIFTEKQSIESTDRSP